ncbi:MAG: bifunctional demethylmenaquinone methyltransferase/2-methoxy-6-polyprenyl-1,4-benzoquinol methylase UbiE [Coxiella sp. (in: Bacteria)]|nr:MAG: bifunctional demethylmenaquinone methyltransferase/2-methoxy-6-polyprenyl-1,4-benzoquinol methylase UbiE [Coxiella sp. (in: g-proteobacteria)]
MTQEAPKTTHFGYEEVPIDQKVKRVSAVFHSVADQYDLMNDLMSLGMHRLWKRFAIDKLNLRPGQNVLDIAGGTGDLTARISRKITASGTVYLADINESMLQVGRSRLLDKGITNNVEFVLANAECLPFSPQFLDRIIIGFGLRNVTDKAAALRSMYQCLKPGGKLVVLEFSRPTLDPLAKLYDAYSFKLLPKIGKWVANDEDSYRYLAESIRQHPNQQTLKTMLQDAGFDDCHYHNLCAGVVAVHTGY